MGVGADIGNRAPDRPVRRRRGRRRDRHQRERRHLTLIGDFLQRDDLLPLAHRLHLPPRQALGQCRIVHHVLQELVIDGNLLLHCGKIRLQILLFVTKPSIDIHLRDRHAAGNQPDAQAHERDRPSGPGGNRGGNGRDFGFLLQLRVCRELHLRQRLIIRRRGLGPCVENEDGFIVQIRRKLQLRSRLFVRGHRLRLRVANEGRFIVQIRQVFIIFNWCREIGLPGEMRADGACRREGDRRL